MWSFGRDDLLRRRDISFEESRLSAVGNASAKVGGILSSASLDVAVYIASKSASIITAGT